MDLDDEVRGWRSSECGGNPSPRIMAPVHLQPHLPGNIEPNLGKGHLEDGHGHLGSPVPTPLG